ncbi:SIMPL domain-containing protein [Aquihabitans sp. G128]|uniref:SIMPL domain-containing protein n=1 Tax=Aquihabitans sp. G128 TaxID=2849779 RepID=UPI001C23036B|nr:SIMPL domain-containing protein [Aquihabitans sp. G128]QXC63288.1 SIMPL domain-containing protein [Aquihabitans sp. G128]
MAATSTGDAGRIRVEGRASRWAPADFAEITFAVARRAKTSGEAVARAGEAYAALDAALAGHAEAIVRRTTTSLAVREVVRYDPKSGKAIREGFEASRGQTARFSPVAGGGAALRSVVVAVPDLVVQGPAFGLDPTNAVHAEVRAEAAAAARASAEAYARGLGLALGAVHRLREPRAGAGGAYDAAGGGGGATFRAMAKAAPEDGGEAVLVDLTDEDVEVVAVVELVIAIAG